MAQRDYRVELASGKHTVSFTVKKGQDISKRVEEELARSYEMPTGDSLPVMTYEDDEGDLINLNLGVAVELEEALRVQATVGNSDVLQFRLAKAVPLRRRPSLLDWFRTPATTTTATATPVDATAVLVGAPVSDASANSENDDAKADSDTDTSENDAAEAEAPATTSSSDADTPAPPTSAAVVMDDLDAVMSQMQNVMQGFTASVAQRETALKSQLEAATEDAATRGAEAAALQTRVAALQSELAAAQQSVQELQQQHAAAMTEHDAVLKDHTAAAAALQSRLAGAVSLAERRADAVQTVHCELLEAQRRLRDAEAAALSFSAEKQSLVDAVAAKQEEVATHQLKVVDLEAANAELTKEREALVVENEALKAKMRTVYDIMKGCMGPAAMAGAQFDKALSKAESFGTKVQAVCVAAKEEVREAVRGVQNYAKKKKQPQQQKKKEVKVNFKALEEILLASESAVAAASAAPASGGGSSSSTKAAAPKPKRKEQRPSPSPSPFVEAMDAQEARPKDRDAFRTVRNMGFSDVTLSQVSKMMKANGDDVSRVIDNLLRS